MGLFGSFVQAFKDGYNGVDEEQDTAPSTKENTAQKPVPAKETAPAQKQAASEEPKFCGACGASLEPGTKFCPKCGEPAMDVAPEHQAVPVEPPHLMPTDTLQAFLDTGCNQMSLLEGAAAYQRVTHADPVFGTEEVNSHFLLHGNEMAIQKVAGVIKGLSEQFFKHKLIVNVDMLPADNRQVVRIYSAEVGRRMEKMMYFTLVQENVRDGAVYYLYMVGDAYELQAKADAGVILSNDENERLTRFAALHDTFSEFISTATNGVIFAVASLNDHQMNGQANFKDGYNGVDEGWDAAPSTKKGAAEKPAPAEGASPVQKPVASEEPKFCGVCGASLEPGTKFCPECGEPAMGVAPEGQAAPAEPPHLMPTNTLEAFNDGHGMKMLEGAAAWQRVTHADPLFGTSEVDSFFLLRGNEVDIQQVGSWILTVSEGSHNDLIVQSAVQSAYNRQVLKIYSAKAGMRFKNTLYFMLVQENVRDGAVYYLYVVGEFYDLKAKADAGTILSSDENEKLGWGFSHTCRNFVSAAADAVLMTFAIMNDCQMNGKPLF